MGAKGPVVHPHMCTNSKLEVTIATLVENVPLKVAKKVVADLHLDLRSANRLIVSPVGSQVNSRPTKFGNSTPDRLLGNHL